MPRINLLPWREELRQERQKNFGIAAGVAVALGAFVVWYAATTYQARIDHQRDRNKYLNTQIAELDKQIEEIRALEDLRDRLIARMGIIDELQRSRPVMVHLFDELVRTLPEGVYLESVQQNSKRILIKGVAQSSTRVSNYMRDLDTSPWFKDAGLNILEKRGESIEFTIFVSQGAPETETPDEAAS
ncbi:MAG: PilN domain-containing protein [Pseudomonadota bacterium]